MPSITFAIYTPPIVYMRNWSIPKIQIEDINSFHITKPKVMKQAGRRRGKIKHAHRARDAYVELAFKWDG